jgi:ABC-type dipeptide/oligopeptide/nickel transport system ATPase subunit
MAKMRRRPEAADELVFGVCHAFLKGEKTEDIATSFGLTREGVYPLVVEGAARNYLLLCPPPQQELTERLAARYKLDPARIRVVATRGKAANEHVSWAGSDLVLDLTREVGARKKRVHLALQLVGLDERAGHVPRQLSGGQEQRVAIARAIVADPTLLVADEPTGDLDAKNAEEILVLLQRLNREMGKTILMVTHDPHAAERAKRVVHLDKGVLSA